MRIAVALISFSLIGSAVSITGCAKAEEPELSEAPSPPSRPARLDLRLPEQGFVVGQTGQLEIRLVDSDGNPAPTAEAITLDISNAAELGLPATVELEAGSAGADLAVTPRRAGLLGLEVRSRGDALDAAYATAATLDAEVAGDASAGLDPSTGTRGGEAAVALTIPEGAFKLDGAALRNISLRELQERPQGSWRRIVEQIEQVENVSASSTQVGGVAEPEAPNDDSPAVPLPIEPSPPTIQPTEPDVSPVEARVELVASPPEVVCGAGGWRPAVVDAYWKVGDKLAKTAEPIEVSLTTSGRAGSLEPTTLTIPANAFRSEKPALVQGRSSGRVEVAARFVGGTPATPIAIDVVSEPGRLTVEGAREVTGLSIARPNVTVRLVDPANPAVSLPIDKPLKIALEVHGATGAQKPIPVTLDPETDSGSAVLELDRHGAYEVTARLACLEAGTLSFRYGLDWLMILVASGAGLVGSLLSYRPRSNPSPTWQKVGWIALSAAVAGVLALGLASFGLLSFFEKLIPLEGLWSKLDELPALSFTATAVTGFFAGLSSDKLWAKLRK